MRRKPGRPKVSEKHGSCVAVWLTEDEKALIKAAAEKDRSKVGPWVARVALKAAANKGDKSCAS